MAQKMWQLGSPGTWLYNFYDELRANLNRKLVDYLLDRAIDGANSTVLEAGSGPAFASSILAKDRRIGLSVAMDIDIEALKEARRRDPSLSLVVADLLNLPFRSGCIDVSWNSSTIEHLDWPGPLTALEEMARVTCRGGKVFVGVPYLYGPLGFQRWIQQTSVGIWIGKTFDGTELGGMLTRVGLKPLHSILYFFRFFVGTLAQKG
jgi:SAM-dependent methyltransferase